MTVLLPKWSKNASSLVFYIKSGVYIILYIDIHSEMIWRFL